MKKNAPTTSNGCPETQLPLLSVVDSNGVTMSAEDQQIPTETPLVIAEKRILELESDIVLRQTSFSNEKKELKSMFERREQAHLVKDANLGEKDIIISSQMAKIHQLKQEIAIQKRSFASLETMHSSEIQALNAEHSAKISTVKTVKKNAVQSVTDSVVVLRSQVRESHKKLTLSNDELKGLLSQYNSVTEAYDRLGVVNEASIANARMHKEENKTLTSKIKALKIELDKKSGERAANQAKTALAKLAIEEAKLEKARVNKAKKLENTALEHSNRLTLVERKANVSVQVHGKKQSTNKKVHNEKMIMATNRLTASSKLHHANNGMFPGLATGPQSLCGGKGASDQLGKTDIKAVSGNV